MLKNVGTTLKEWLQIFYGHEFVQAHWQKDAGEVALNQELIWFMQFATIFYIQC